MGAAPGVGEGTRASAARPLYHPGHDRTGTGQGVRVPRTVLVSAPGWAAFPIVPHALLELAAALRAAGLEVALIDEKAPQYSDLAPGAIDRIVDRIVDAVVRLDPDWIGLPCYTTDYWHCRELARRLRARHPARLVVGGPHATLRPQDFFYPGSPFDAVVIGEGDETLPELVAAAAAGRPLDEVPGLALLRAGRVVRTAPRPLVADLGTLARPAYDLLDLDHYLAPNRYLLRTLVVSGLQVYASRGCPYGCTFCAARMIHEANGGPPSIRHRPVAEVVGTLRWLRDTHGLEAFYLADDTFAAPRARALEFCDAYRSAGLALPWGAQTRVNALDAPLARALREAGCVQLDFGLESGSDDALRRMRKGTTVAQARSAVAACRAEGLRVYANVMFNTPGETEDDVRATRRLMHELGADHYGVLLTAPMPGTRVFQERFGVDGLGPEDWRLFARPDLYNRLVDPRFRLAAHRLDLGRLYLAVSLRWYLRNNLRLASSRGWYLRLLRRSRRKGAYLRAYLSSTLGLVRRSAVKLARLAAAAR